MSMIYKWRADSRFPIGAQIAAERLNQIKAARGDITPHAVVEDASNEASPLHPCFEWNDDKAAEQFRLAQARKLIGSIVVAEIEGKHVEEVRAFVHLTAETLRYEPVEVAMRNSDMRAEVLERAQREIRLWRARYAAYEEFSAI
ncbi:MAG: hypothetical protein RIS45_752, partial [Planctomycetota bacterium]